MRIFSHHKRTLLVIAIMTACVIAFTKCVDHQPEKKIRITNPRGEEFAGSATCRDCHKAIYDSFLSTAHHLASGLPSKEYIKGSFADDNTFNYDARRKVVMESHADGLYQTAYEDGKQTRSERFDIVVGTGKKGQTFLYWKNNELFQLPIAYFANGNVWVNSPGYPTDKIYYDRTIEGRCLECHVTFAKEQFSNSEFTRDQIIYGVECERCHGPAAKHVEFQQQNPSEMTGKYIIKPHSLPRQQKMDVCAVCHSGVMERLSPAFYFTPGDTLSKYFIRNSSRIDSFKLDVHANQYGLLTASKCYRMTEIMNCGTCHNTHVKEKGDLSLYGEKCMSCHAENNHNFCAFQPPAGFSMQANCVNCHMPVRESKNITAVSNGKPAPQPELVRSHYIAIYPDEIKKWVK